MRRSGVDTQTVLWVVLVLATVGTLVLSDTAVSGESLVGTAVLVIAFVKLRLVGIHFMEIGRAPRALRALFETYVGATFVTLFVLYQFA